MSQTSEPRRILAVTDLGPNTGVFIRAAAARARALDAAFAVVHTLPSLEMVRPLFTNLLAGDALDQVKLQHRVQLELDRQLTAVAAEGPVPEVFLETGRADEMALRVAERWAADLIVIGALEGDSLEAERVVRHAQVPVLVIRPGPSAGAVVVCTDLSDPSLPAVRMAAEEATRAGERLVVLHAIDPSAAAAFGVGHERAFGEIERAAREEAERRLAEMCKDNGVGGDQVVVSGRVVPILVATARERGARLMVIGTHGRTGVGRFLLGSAAESLVRVAPCSTLVVRLREKKS